MDMYQNTLESLNASLPLQEKLARLHQVVQKQLPFVARIAITLYDPTTALPKSYLDSSSHDPLPNYGARLSDAPSLTKILEEGQPRVIDNALTFEDAQDEHTRRIGREGYSASYTMPIFSNGVFLGFIFFNSFEPDVFTDRALHQLGVFGHLIALMVINELTAMRTLVATVAATSRYTHSQDLETGSHIDRLSRYARLIARELAPRHELDDNYIEYVFMYSPLHDIGKITIPDRILSKPDRLDRAERDVMRTHSQRGREIIDDALRNFGLDDLHHMSILRNIAEFHHETLNGRGYPAGLRGNAVPLEARIVAVADIFDALTSRRPYRNAWTIDEALEVLEQMAGEELDGECVAALVRCREEVERIQEQFLEDPIG
jgi:HD-GYP domain-containing protein (c-di-GMP phosphodiesterase class II)